MVGMAPRLKRGLLFHKQQRESTLIDAARDYMDGLLTLDAFQEVIRQNDTDYSEISLEIAQSRKSSRLSFLSFLFS